MGAPAFSGRLLPGGAAAKGFPTKEVRRHGQAVILEPIATDWAWLEALIGPLNEDFVEAATNEPEEQERPALNFFE